MGWDLEVRVLASRPAFQKGWKVSVAEYGGIEVAGFGSSLDLARREAVSQYLHTLAIDIAEKNLEACVDSIRFTYKVDKPRKKRDASRVRGKQKK